MLIALRHNQNLLFKVDLKLVLLLIESAEDLVKTVVDELKLLGQKLV
jgi:hypothetical protein